MAKKHQKHLIWTQNGHKQGDRIFFLAWCLNKKCREWSNLLKYAKLGDKQFEDADDQQLQQQQQHEREQQQRKQQLGTLKHLGGK